MSYIKGYSFLKRTCVLLSPLFLLTLASKELAFYAPAATLSPILSDPKEEKDSIINLASSLNQELPEGVEDYGTLKIQKTSYYSDLWIEESNSFSTFKHNKDFKFKEATNIIDKDNDRRYVLKKVNFEDIKGKGDINILTTFDLITGEQDPIFITHVIPLADLTTVSSKIYTVVTTHLDGFDNSKKQHSLTVTKDAEKQEIVFELDIFSNVRPSSSLWWEDLSSLAIKSFYILFNDNPPLDPKSYFTINQSSDVNIVGGDAINSKSKKVFLNKWSNSQTSKPPLKNPEEPTYEFKTDSDFWKSTCSDPYKVGGFIDKDLKQQEQEQEKLKKQQQDSKKIELNGKSHLEKQMKSWMEMTPYKHERPKRDGQYFWKQTTTNGSYVPHDESTNLYEPCVGIESETKNKFKEYWEKSLFLEKTNFINTKLTPKPLAKEVNNGNGQTGSQNMDKTYPQHKIVQSSFRAWGNAYLSSNNENIKDSGKYSEQFERANSSNHTFSIKLPKNKWTQYLTKEHLDKSPENKKLNESPDVSSLLEVYYPLSFSFYDPISGYLKKHSLFLKTELDLSYLYLSSSYSKEVFKFDIGNENREIGKDYQGFEPHLNKDKEKPYGLDGSLSFISKLELDQNKDLNIHLTTKVSGFVNTKNPSCDLRHRLYKITQSGYNNGNATSLSENWKCSKEIGWQYRDYIHIPSFLVLSLTGEPEISSYYIDRQSGVSEELKKPDSEEPKTLKKFGDELDQKEIVVVVETDDATKADVYFKDIATYGNLTDGIPYSLDSWYASRQQVYYWYPKRAKGKLTDIDFTNLKSITLYFDGSKNSYNSFFHSSHFNTLTTLCTNDKYTLSNSNSGKEECADGNKYDKSQKDKTPSELHESWGSQKVVIDVSGSKLTEATEDKAQEVKFRVAYNRADRREKKEKPPAPDKDEFNTIKSKLECFFQDKQKNPEHNKIPDVSMLAFWYSVFLWKDDSKKELHYATQVRPIGLITQTIKNSTSHLAVGAAGSAGFEISKFEFRYSKS